VLLATIYVYMIPALIAGSTWRRFIHPNLLYEFPICITNPIAPWAIRVLHITLPLCLPSNSLRCRFTLWGKAQSSGSLKSHR
jgi:hypothetical protein